MQTQANISKEINKRFIGKEIPVLIEGIFSNGQIIARSYRDAPDIDGLVYIKTEKNIIPGEIEQAKVYEVNEYDLFAEI